MAKISKKDSRSKAASRVEAPSKKLKRALAGDVQRGVSSGVKGMPTVTIGALAEKNMVDYGSYTVMHRAIPMLYDGLKPVHRRIMYAMFKTGLFNNFAHRKAAKVVGETMGNYHPHGDAAIYGAMVGLSTGNGTPLALIDGQGNWGNFDGSGPTKGAAASRYTECRLTKYAGDQLVSKPYMDEEVIPYVPNYDGSTSEPLYLPSLLPSLFLIGAEGIATGVTVNMPAYTYESVLAATKTLLKTGSGKKASAKLVPTQRWGATCIATQEELNEYHNTGISRIAWQAAYTINRGKGGTVISMTGLPPITYETLYEGLLKIKGVASVVNLSSKKDGMLINITVKDESVLSAVKKRLIVNESYKSATTLLVDQGAGLPPAERYKVAFETWAPNTILEKWLEWRVALEKRLIKSLIRDNDAEIKRLQLMILAASKLDIIFEILKAKSGDKVAMIEKRLKVTNEEAKEIWQMAVRQLDKLNADETREKVKKLEATNKSLKADYKTPQDRILRMVEALPKEDPNSKKRG